MRVIEVNWGHRVRRSLSWRQARWLICGTILLLGWRAEVHVYFSVEDWGLRCYTSDR